MHWSPNGEEELARRRAAGLPVGVDLRRRNRGLAGPSWPWRGTAPVSINSLGTTAALATVELTSYPGLLQCQNCHVEMTSSYSITLQYCLASSITANSLVFWATSADSSGCLGYLNSPAPNGATCTAPDPITTQNFLDCAGTVSWITGVPPATPVLNNPNTFNAALNIEAYTSGNANLNFLLNSNGYPSSLTTPPSFFSTGGCTSSQSSNTCTQQPIIPYSTAKSISIVTGFTADIRTSMTAAAVLSGVFSGGLQVGISGTSTGYMLGGKCKCSRLPLNSYPCA